MESKVTKEQVENIQLDHGILFKNYGLPTQEFVAPLRGGTNFKVERTYRNIEFDGAKGKTKGLTTLDDENATLTAKTLNASLESFADKLPGAKITRDEETKKITKIEASEMGILPDNAYIENVTVFGQKISGEFVKITITNAMDENGLEFAAVQKAEGEIELAYAAHHTFDEEPKVPLYTIENIKEISYDAPKTEETQTSNLNENQEEEA